MVSTEELLHQRGLELRDAPWHGESDDRRSVCSFTGDRYQTIKSHAFTGQNAQLYALCGTTSQAEVKRSAVHMSDEARARISEANRRAWTPERKEAWSKKMQEIKKMSAPERAKYLTAAGRKSRKWRDQNPEKYARLVQKQRERRALKSQQERQHAVEGMGGVQAEKHDERDSL